MDFFKSRCWAALTLFNFIDIQLTEKTRRLRLEKSLISLIKSSHIYIDTIKSFWLITVFL